MSIIMGIDPGYCATGWVLVDSEKGPVRCGVIRTKPRVGRGYVHEDTWRRCTVLACELTIFSVFRRRPPGIEPDCYVIEAPAGSQSAKAAAATAMAYAICAVTVMESGKPSVRVTAGDAKKAATGKRTASKSEVQAAVLKKWPALEAMALEAVGKAKSKVEHIYDAAACVIAGWDTDVVRAVRGR